MEPCYRLNSPTPEQAEKTRPDWKRISKTKCCLTCHYLAKSCFGREEDNSQWTTYETLRFGVIETYTTHCFRGVWHDEYKPDQEILLKNRQGDCFYLKRREGMSFEAAIEFQDQKEARRRSQYTWAISITALTISIAYIVIKLL